MSAARRYELSDKEWEKISPLLPPEKTGSKDRPSKDNKTMFNAIVWLARSVRTSVSSGLSWRDLPERYGAWETVYSKFNKRVYNKILDNIFRMLSLEAELSELSIDSTIVRAPDLSGS